MNVIVIMIFGSESTMLYIMCHLIFIINNVRYVTHINKVTYFKFIYGIIVSQYYHAMTHRRQHGRPSFSDKTNITYSVL